MNLDQRIKALVKLGEFLGQFAGPNSTKNSKIPNNELFYDGFQHQLQLSQQHNGWFTIDNLHFAINYWHGVLKYDALKSWLSSYHLDNAPSKIVAIVMAGNIPLVGFHDLITVLLVGHKVKVKLSSNDKHLIPYLVKYLEHIEPGFKGKVEFTEGKLEDFEAVIATGSNNTARYFEYYFKGKPSIIRKNRNSIAVLTGAESDEQLSALSQDIFRYYGLGCRNVSKLFVPKDYNFDAFFNAMFSWKDIINDQKYANNYDYNKAVYLMSEFDLLDNGFLMLKQDENNASPIATLFYEYYSDRTQLEERLDAMQEDIQCIVSSNFKLQEEIAFGQTQYPKLSQYADGIDTVDFLLKI